ncbi:S41 family peptidase [Patescibacteria group bacterium]|nr:S41 family peptidase [Patescibacteria group bacterium]
MRKKTFAEFSNVSITMQASAKKKNLRFGLAIIGIIVLIIISSVGGFVIGKITSGKINLKLNPDIYKETELPKVFQNSLVEQVWTLINSDFVDKEKIDEQKIFYSALEGLVAGLDDPYTVFFDPKTNEEFELQISGEFEGIGAQLGLKDGIATVIAPLPDTPASRAGLKSGDKILAVDGKEVVGEPLDKVVHLIRGSKGTEVTLLIVSGEEEARDVKILRDTIKMKSVKWKFLENNIAYVEMSGFNGDTDDLFSQFVREAKSKNVQGIILDLRNNPGGFLDTALNISSAWIQDDLLLIEKMGDGNEIKYNAENNSPLKGIKTVVLINEGSASASEIVAGAFQDYKIADIVGKKSFGKGSVQALKKLPDGSALKITIAKWLTPNGRSINEEGIAPDIEVDLTKEDYENKKDPQLDKALELLKK